MTEKPSHYPIGEFDAAIWAEEFVRTTAENPSIAHDEGTMIAWFSGAIMTGYGARRWRFGDRVEDGGIMGTIVRCETCGGSGELHQPDVMPEFAEPSEG